MEKAYHPLSVTGLVQGRPDQRTLLKPTAFQYKKTIDFCEKLEDGFNATNG
jgi:hypothetical protein